MLETLAKKYNLLNHIERLKKLSNACWLGSGSQNPMVLGCSKIGGFPHVDEGFVWPKFQQKPLTFIAQINLSELQASQLPDSGLLLFFYATGVYANTQIQKNFIRVIYISDIEQLEIKEPEIIQKKRLLGLLKPQRTPEIYAELRIEFSKGVSLPDLDLVDSIPALSMFDDSDELLDSYCDLKWGLSEQAVLQVGGYPNPVQYDGMAAGAAAVMEKGCADDWQLLLEVDSKLGFMWGDAGRLYFHIHKDDLKAKKFSDVWMEFQCH